MWSDAAAAIRMRGAQCVMDKLPGMLKEVTGMDIPEYTMISPAEGGKVTVDWDGTVMEAAVFSDLLAPEEGAETVGVYTSSYYAGTAGPDPSPVRKRTGPIISAAHLRKRPRKFS